MEQDAAGAHTIHAPSWAQILQELSTKTVLAGKIQDNAQISLENGNQGVMDGNSGPRNGFGLLEKG
jgi:hypothetical protein